MESVAMEALRAGFATDQSPLWRSQIPRVMRMGTTVGVGALEEAEADRTLEVFAGVLAKFLLAGESQTTASRESGTRDQPRYTHAR
jgi:hypothetical protein